MSGKSHPTEQDMLSEPHLVLDLPDVVTFNEKQQAEIESLRRQFSENDLFGEEEESAVLHRMDASKWRLRVTSQYEKRGKTRKGKISVNLTFEYTSKKYPDSDNMPTFSLDSTSKHVDTDALTAQLSEQAGWWNRLVVSEWATFLQSTVDDAERKRRKRKKQDKHRRMMEGFEDPKAAPEEPEDAPPEKHFLDDFFAEFPHDPRPFLIFSIGKGKGKGGWFNGFPVVNCRCIDNKSKHIDYRKGRGTDADIQENVMRWSSSSAGHDFENLFRTTVAKLQRDGHNGVAFQCSRGHHRSVAMACLLHKRVFVNAVVQHVEMATGAPRPKFETAVRKAKKAGWRPK